MSKCHVKDTFTLTVLLAITSNDPHVGGDQGVGCVGVGALNGHVVVFFQVLGWVLSWW